MRLRTPSKGKWHSRTPKIKLKANTSRTTAHHAPEEDLYPDSEDDGNSMKLSHAFFVVLILHLILIGGIFGFNYIKARKIPALPSHNKVAVKPTAVSSPAKDSLSTVVKSPAHPSASLPHPEDSVSHTHHPTNHARISSPSTVHEPPVPVTNFEKIVQSSKFRTHRITEGDTLEKIATAYGVTSSQIEKANGTVKNLLGPGQLLRIPPRNTPSPPISQNNTLPKEGSQPIATPLKKGSSALAHTSSKKEKHPTIYVVVPGDNPYSIARKFKMSYIKLLSFNKIQDPTKLQIGTKLKIPPKE